MPDVVLLSRIQFALTAGFHYLFPPLSIGLSLMIVIFEGMYIKTGKQLYLNVTKFWVRIFALSFAVGVATGIVQVFSFGTNWGRFSEFVGDVFGSVLAAEGIFAFFLEAGFIGIMLFGWDKVSKGVHYLSTILVAVGAHFSATWIVAANSWMQTPAGFKIVGEGSGARAVITSYWDLVFNPSFLDRITHVVLGAWLTGIFMVVSVSAFYLLKKRHLEFAKSCMHTSLVMGAIVVLLQLASADSTARGVSENQPVKLAAMEGVFKTQPYTPLYILGWTDAKDGSVHGIPIPGLLSFLTYRNFEKPIPGLDQFKPEYWPPVGATFQVYHLMIWMWGGMFLAMLFGWILRKDWRLEKARWLLWFMVISVAFPFIANEAGWFTAEMGRQPWVVYGILKTVDGTSRSVIASQVIASLIMYVVIYTAILALFLFLVDRKIKHGPTDEGEARLDDLIYRDPYHIRGEV